MSIIKWRPIFDMDSMSDMDKFFQGFGSIQQNFMPALDVYQDENNVIVEAPLPGLDPEKVNIAIENDVLTIEGKEEKKKEVDEKEYYMKEVRTGSFHRSVQLPVAVEGDKAEAEYKKGVLTVKIPKAERAKPKKIEVKMKDEK